MKKILLIPSRLASTRLPEKPFALIKGKPMIERVLEQALKANLDQTYVACCDPRLKTFVEQKGGKALLTDPDLPSGTDRVYQALEQINDINPDDIIVNLQGDLPFINPLYLQLAANLLQQTCYDIATLAAVSKDLAKTADTSTVKVVLTEDPNHPRIGRALYFSRSVIPHASPIFYHHIGIYAFRYTSLQRFVEAPPSPLETCEKLEQLRALELGMSIGVQLVDEMPLSIDTPADLEAAQTWQP